MKLMVRRLILLLVSLIAGTASATDLMDIYHGAKANDALYAAARAQFRAMRERLPQARAGVAPAVSRSGTFKRYIDEDNGGLPALTFGSRRGHGAELAQPAYPSP
ncbi:MAG: hypothetical protein JSW48_14210 [Betaproteobacteria bacterium]|nr:MAG: hypothetical protein JSW48_14210 [Betaproteobacteria bacterium]